MQAKPTSTAEAVPLSAPEVRLPILGRLRGERTIAGDLALGLAVVVGGVFLLILTLSSLRMFEEDSASLKDKSLEIMNNLADVLIAPLWNLNQKEIERIIDVYQKYGTLAFIKVEEVDGTVLAQRQITAGPALAELSRELYHQSVLIGYLRVGLSSAQLEERQANLMSSMLVTALVVVVTVGLSTYFLLGAFLGRPLAQVLSELDHIASGQYQHRLQGFRQREIREMARQINKMAQAVASRERAIARQSAWQAKLAAEIEVAETIQRSFLPAHELATPNYRVASYYRAATGLGGDWFKLLHSADGRQLYLIMGDVTGHGLAQGLVTTAVLGCLGLLEDLLAQGAANASEPHDILRMLDACIARVIGSSRLMMTCVALRIDFSSGQIRMANAGHTFPLLVGTSHGEALIRPLTQQQPMLGATAGAGRYAYVDVDFSLAVGERLCVYTDGLVEALNQEGRSFQRQFLRLLRHSDPDTPLGTLREDIVEAVQSHIGKGGVQADDICLVMVEAA